MPSPISPLKPSNIVSQEAPQVATTGAATLLTYTAPAGKVAQLQHATIDNITGTAPNVSLQLLRGADVVAMSKGVGARYLAGGAWLLAGDTLRWQCTTGGAGSAVDVSFSLAEYEAQ